MKLVQGQRGQGLLARGHLARAHLARVRLPRAHLSGIREYVPPPNIRHKAQTGIRECGLRSGCVTVGRALWQGTFYANMD